MKSEKPLTSGRITALVLGAVCLYWGLNHLGAIGQALRLLFGFFFPFVFGFGLAFLLNIPMRAIERGLIRLCRCSNQRKLRPVSLSLTLVAVLGVLAGAVFVVMPQLGDTISSIGQQIPGFLENCQLWLQTLLTRYPALPDFLNSLDLTAFSDLPGSLTALLGGLGSQILGSSILVATSVFSGVANFFIALVFALYLLAGKERLLCQLNRVLSAFLPRAWAVRLRSLARLVNKTFSSFFTGQCLEACILGLLFFAAMSALGFPYALLISVLVGFTALIPVFGAFIGCAVGAVLILVQDPVRTLWFVVLFLVIQQLEGNLIYPRVVGSSVGLPPIWVLAAVSLGASMFGVVGMLLFIPIVSVLYTLLREETHRRLRKKAAASPAPDSPATI